MAASLYARFSVWPCLLHLNELSSLRKNAFGLLLSKNQKHLLAATTVECSQFTDQFVLIYLETVPIVADLKQS